MIREVVLPEGTPAPERDRPRAPTVVAVGVAVLALLAATLALGQATSPPEEVVADSTSTTEIAPVVEPTTTTTIDIETFSADDIATGERFFWVNAPPSGRLWPIDMIEHDGLVYLFGSQDVTTSGSARGASAWVSADGVQWDQVGGVIPETNTVHRVVSTEWGLIALGEGSDGTPRVWMSSDGRSFLASPLPFDRSTDGSRFEITDAEVSNGVLVVIGAQVPDHSSEVLDALPETMVASNQSSIRLEFEPAERDENSIINVFAPMGLHAASLRMEELGFDQGVQSILVGPDAPPRQFMWSTRDGLTWQMEDLGSSIVDELWHHPSGDLVAYGRRGQGSAVTISANDMTWRPQVRSSRKWWNYEIAALAAWNGSMVGGGQGEQLFVSSDGLSWQPLGTGELLPDSINWRMGPAGTGEAGLVAVARALRANNPPVFRPVVIESGDATLTVDLQDARLIVDRPGYEQLEVFLWTKNTLGHYEVDLAQEIVTFVDPPSRETLATVGFETLEKAESSAFAIDRSSERALLFTPDGNTWSVQSLSNVVSETHEVESIVVLDDRVLLLTYDSAGLGASIPPRVSVVIGQISP